MDQALQDKVFTEQIKILHRNLLASVPTNLICAAIVLIGLQHSESLLWSWFTTVFLVSIFRMFGFAFYRYRPSNNNLHLTIFIFGMTLSAILWGVVGSIFMPPNNPMEQMIVIIIIAGVTSGGIQTLNANLIASQLYITTIIIPLCIWLFMQNGTDYFLLGVIMIAYIIFMLATSRRTYKLMTTALTLQYENAALVDKLSVSNSQLLQASKTLYEQSTHDPLTGLFNRRYLDETLSRELHRIMREKQSLCVAMLDLDYFKRFNDTHGHDAGDELLKFTGKLLQETFRGSDISCRFGGEEFLVTLVNTDIHSAKQRLESFRQAIKNGNIIFQGLSLPAVTVSIGVAEAPLDGHTVKDIIHAADRALYAAKQAGRDRVVEAVHYVTY